MSLIERIYQLSDFKDDSIYKISKDIGVSNGYFAKTKAKGGSVGGDIIEKIVSYYPDLNVEWLITGKGEILKTKNENNLINLNDKNFDKVFDKKRNVENSLSNEKTKSEKNVTVLNSNKNSNNFGNKRNVEKKLPNERTNVVAEDQVTYSVPLIPIDAMAGFGTGAVQVMDYDTETYVVPEFTELKVDFMIRVKGSSMYPKYNSGDLVACKKLSLSDIFFQWNKVYVLDTEQGALIKRIKKSEKPKCITLVSENASYDAFELSLSEIHAIALVVGVIRLE